LVIYAIFPDHVTARPFRVVQPDRTLIHRSEACRLPAKLRLR
jgi:hypothetical protein